MAFLSSFYPQPVVPNAIEVTASGSTAARALATRFADTINVKDYGATGNGSTNDQAAIQAAINAAPNNSCIYFPRGAYLLSDGGAGLSVGKNLTFYGDGEQSIIALNKTAHDGFRIGAGTSFAAFRDLSVVYQQGYFNTGTYASGGYYQIAVNIQSSVNANCELVLSNVHFENFANSIYLGGPIKVLHVSGCHFNYRHGVAGIVWYTPVGGDLGHPTQTIVGGGETTIVTNCYFNGLVDSAFSGVVGSPPSSGSQNAYRAIDGFYFTGGASPLYQEISNCTVLNHDIEGIVVGGLAPEQAYFANSALDKAVISLTSTASGNATFPTLVTATVNAHGYSVGDVVSISGVIGSTDAAYNGTHVIQTVATNTFTYLTGVVASATASGAIVANVNKAATRRTAVVKNNYVSACSIKTEHYAGTQPCIRINDNAGGNVQIVGNTICGAVDAILALADRPWPSGVSKFAPQIKDNVIRDVNVAIHLASTHNQTFVCGNSIMVSSKWSKAQTTWAAFPNAYCVLVPILLSSARGTLIKDNELEYETPLWDQTVTVTSRNNGSNSFTVTNGAAISASLSPLDRFGGQDYGVLFAFVGGVASAYPLTNIVGNDLIIDAALFNAQTSFTTGTAYWAKTRGSLWSNYAAISGINSSSTQARIINNSFNNVTAWDVLPTGGGTWVISNNIYSNSEQIWTVGVNRRGSEVRASNSLINGVPILAGAGAPSTSAQTGSLYVRTDGDASTTLYVRANNEWKPLSAWNP